MDEHALHGLISDVKAGRLSRRTFVQTMIGLGLTAPLAAQMLASAGVAHAQPKAPAAPAAGRRGGGGPLKTLWWQAPTLLNPHFATGTKDQDASRIFYEPLAGFDPDGNIVPVLASEVPSVSAGTLARDLTWVTWKLKRGVTWHDGKPFTADDVVFNWEFVADPATSAVTSGSYREISKIETPDPYTVKLVFNKPQPFWADAFCGARGQIIPKHHFDAYRGAKSREAPANLKPVGTGAFRFVDFKPGDVVRAEINPGYHVPNRPFFDTLEMKGGGDAVSAARAVLQTGEYDYAWNMQVEDEILLRFEQGSKGRVNIWPTGSHGAHPAQQHRSVDRGGRRALEHQDHPPAPVGPRGTPGPESPRGPGLGAGADLRPPGPDGGQLPQRPLRFRSSNMKWEFNVEKAAALLETAGWKRGGDGIRAKDGKRLKMLYQTSINAPRQKNQQIVKQAAAKAGIELELKSVTASVFFSSDPANPDTYPHFYSDIQMYNNGPNAPDPQYFMNQFVSWEVASKANKWQGRNITRWRNEEYDRAYTAADSELDPVKRAALFIKMNDLVIQNVVVIPVLWRNGASASVANLRGMDLSGWESTFWRLPYWTRQG